MAFPSTHSELMTYMRWLHP